MAELVEECPLTKRHRAKGNAATAAKARRAADVRCVTPQRELVGPAKDLEGRARPRCMTPRTRCETSAWKQGHTQREWCPQCGGPSAPRSTAQAWTPKNSISSTRSTWRGKSSETRVNDHAQRMDKKRKQKSIANSRQKRIANSKHEDMKSNYSWQKSNNCGTERTHSG